MMTISASTVAANTDTSFFTPTPVLIAHFAFANTLTTAITVSGVCTPQPRPTLPISYPLSLKKPVPVMIETLVQMKS